MEKVDRPVLERRKIALELRPHTRGGERVVELVEVGVELSRTPILAGVDLTMLRGERVGVDSGENSARKSVLLRLLAGTCRRPKASARPAPRSGSANLRRTIAPTIPMQPRSSSFT